MGLLPGSQKTVSTWYTILWTNCGLIVVLFMSSFPILLLLGVVLPGEVWELSAGHYVNFLTWSGSFFFP